MSITFVEEVRRVLYEKYGEKSGFTMVGCRCGLRSTQGCRIYAVSVLRSGLVRYDRRHGYRGCQKHFDPKNGDWNKTLSLRLMVQIRTVGAFGSSWL